MTRHLSAALRLPRTLGRHRFLVRQLAWRAFAARHAGSYLGWLWTPVTTAVQFALYMVVFSAILQIKIDGLGIDIARRPVVGFGVFLITGLVPFLALNDVVLRAARVFRAHASLVQRVRMPPEVLVISDAAGTLMHHAISFALVVAFCLWKGHLGLGGVPWLICGLGLLVLWIIGASLWVSIVGAFLPDVAEVMGLVMQVLFYAAPIVYPLALVRTEWVRTVIEKQPRDAAPRSTASRPPRCRAAVPGGHRVRRYRRNPGCGHRCGGAGQVAGFDSRPGVIFWN